MHASLIHQRGRWSQFTPLAALAMALACQIGCQAPPQPSGPTQMMLRVTDKDAFIDDTLTMLRELDFPPDRVDREAGTISAGPSTGGQWFEIWRRDVHGGYQILESSIHTIRREVGIRIEQVSEHDDSDEYRVSVEVSKFRYSAPDRQVTTASSALEIFSERLPTTEGLRHSRSASSGWVPLGRDGLLENALLARIARFSQSGVAEAVSEESDEADESG